MNHWLDMTLTELTDPLNTSPNDNEPWFQYLPYKVLGQTCLDKQSRSEAAECGKIHIITLITIFILIIGADRPRQTV